MTTCPATVHQPLPAAISSHLIHTTTLKSTPLACIMDEKPKFTYIKRFAQSHPDSQRRGPRFQPRCGSNVAQLEFLWGPRTWEQVKISKAAGPHRRRVYSKCSWEPWRILSRGRNGKMCIFWRTLAVVLKWRLRARLEARTLVPAPQQVERVLLGDRREAEAESSGSQPLFSINSP